MLNNKTIIIKWKTQYMTPKTMHFTIHHQTSTLASWAIKMDKATIMPHDKIEIMLSYLEVEEM